MNNFFKEQTINVDSVCINGITYEIDSYELIIYNYVAGNKKYNSNKIIKDTFNGVTTEIYFSIFFNSETNNNKCQKFDIDVAEISFSNFKNKGKYRMFKCKCSRLFEMHSLMYEFGFRKVDINAPVSKKIKNRPPRYKSYWEEYWDL